MNQLNLSLPDWINSFLNEYPKIIPDPEKQMRFVLALTERNIREETGGPFGAAVFERHSGKLVSVGVNVVVRQNCSAAHAEMMALMLAQKELGHFDLGAERFPEHRLVTSGKMCAMCLGNVCWSGVSEVLSSAEPEDVEKISGFDEGPTPPRIITRSLNEGELKLCLNYCAVKAEMFYSFMLILAVRFITQDTVRNQV